MSLTKKLVSESKKIDPERIASGRPFCRNYSSSPRDRAGSTPLFWPAFTYPCSSRIDYPCSCQDQLPLVRAGSNASFCKTFRLFGHLDFPVRIIFGLGHHSSLMEDRRRITIQLLLSSDSGTIWYSRWFRFCYKNKNQGFYCLFTPISFHDLKV